MLISEQIASRKSILKRAVSDSLSASYQRTWTRCMRNAGPPQEPDYIVDLSLSWIGDFTRLLQIVLNNKFAVGVTGVYCHQKPLADYGHSPRPEIGDLLLVMEYRELGQAPAFNSLLLQAKSSTTPSFAIGSGDLHQLRLYEEWPQFKYMRAGKLDGQSRDIHPKCISSGGKFLLLDPSYVHCVDLPGHFPFGCAVPNRSIVLTSDFADELIEFLTFNSGRAISSRNSVTEDWSRMIWDLLDITKAICAKRSRSGLQNGFDRQTASNTHGFFRIEGDTTNSHFGGFQGEPPDGRDDQRGDDSGGVSTIYVQISEREFE